MPDELKEDPTRLTIGRTVTGGSLGMAALEGYAAAIDVSGFLSVSMHASLVLPDVRQPQECLKISFLVTYGTSRLDDAKHLYWNSSPALDNLTWTTVPAELKHDINCSMLLVHPSPKFSELFSTLRHSLYCLDPSLPLHKATHGSISAAVPPTIPAKHPAETPAEQRLPGPKFVKLPSQTTSPALATEKKKTIPQSSPLVPPAPAPAPPSSALASPAPQASPPKPPSREPPESDVIDLTQPTPELVPALVQNRPLPSKPNPPQQAPSLPNLA
ncbi:hypothetical protein F5148DRAFT_1290011 [Russula earlei]|uniref:Uncharacterized protein n=1 Tax=Russula earlei TaxID=71964 RepID=A0ACC0TXC8_9AGAM|nr:hypothetical protein F5148DRAFT_1290011 [Russula earlei]